LAQWVRLAEKYPKALEALVKIRDIHESNLSHGKAGLPEFHEFSAINEYLKEEEKTYVTFAILDKKFPEIAKDAFHVVKDKLVDRADYQVFFRYVKDPLGQYEDIRHLRETNLSLMRKNPKLDDPKFRKYTDNDFMQSTRRLVEALMGVGRKSEALEVQKRALSYFDHPEIRSAVSDAEAKLQSQKAASIRQ
jgi:hypothetical protein